MLNIVLQVSVSRALRIAQPRRNENPHGNQPLRMYVEEPEDLRLGKSECVPDGPGLERRVFRQLDHHLHPERPLAPRVTGRQAKLLIQLLSHRAHRPVANNGEPRAHIHTGHVSLSRNPVSVHSLVG